MQTDFIWEDYIRSTRQHKQGSPAFLPSMGGHHSHSAVRPLLSTCNFKDVLSGKDVYHGIQAF